MSNGIYGDMFDMNGDGHLDIGERAGEFLYFQKTMKNAPPRRSRSRWITSAPSPRPAAPAAQPHGPRPYPAPTVSGIQLPDDAYLSLPMNNLRYATLCAYFDKAISGQRKRNAFVLLTVPAFILVAVFLFYTSDNLPLFGVLHLFAAGGFLLKFVSMRSHLKDLRAERQRVEQTRQDYLAHNK